MTVDSLIFEFFLFSAAGWIIEFLYRSMSNRKPVNPGFMYGPYVPLYGAGASILIITHHFIKGEDLLIRALAYLIVTTMLEYLTGEALLFFFKKRYWDYSDNFLNFRALVCPSFSLAWVAASFVFEFVLYPISGFVMGHMTLPEIRAMNVLMVFAFTIDFVFATGLAYRAREHFEPFLRERFRDFFAGVDRQRLLAPAFSIARKRLIDIRSEMPAAREILRRYRDDLARRTSFFEWRRK